MNSEDLLREFIQHRPVDDVRIRSAVQALMDENDALKLALLHGPANKIRYAGKIEEHLFLDAVCECGEVINFNHKRKVPWNVIRDVLSLVQKRAELLK